MFSPSTRIKPHHSAWLSAHPERDQEWLFAMFTEGFDVHHIDDNHANNDPRNLVLMEHVDHMRLHGLGMVRRYNAPKKGAQARHIKPKKMTLEAIRKRRVRAKRAARARWRAVRANRRALKVSALTSAQRIAPSRARSKRHEQPR